MKPHLQCAEQQVSRSNLTKYCACHAERLTYLVLITYETSFTVRGATGVTIQPHQILRLSRRKTHLLNHHYIWNLIYNARSNRCHYPTSPNTAPATQNDHLTCGRNLRKTSETSFPMRGRSETDPTMIRPWKRKPQPASPRRLLFELTTSIFYWKIQRFAPNLTFTHSPSAAPATKSDTWTSPSTAPATKSDAWTSPSTAPATKSDTWTSPSIAPATKSDIWTSPSTAPATKNDSYAWSSLHMKPHFQCAEQQVSLSNLTKYCACHAKWPLNLWQKFAENKWNVISNAGTIRDRSDHDPTMKTQTATRLATEVTFRAHHEHFLLKNTTFRAQSYIHTFTKCCACHKKWHLNFTKYCTCHEKWRLNFTKYCTCHEKWHLNFTKYCTCHEKWHLNFTKYCTCHEKWLLCLILVTYETSFPMRGATGVTIQPHQILRLPRKMTT